MAISGTSPVNNNLSLTCVAYCCYVANILLSSLDYWLSFAPTDRPTYYWQGQIDDIKNCRDYLQFDKMKLNKSCHSSAGTPFAKNLDVQSAI